MKTITIIQGRMNSSRLPGKILLEIAGQPMLARVYVRAARASTVKDTLFATTEEPSDDLVAEYCDLSGIPLYRGSQFDVLDRYYRAAALTKAEVVVRVTADCPVIDPALIDVVVRTLAEGGFDFACNRLPPPWKRTFPIGLDVEACTFRALRRAWSEATEPQHREHAMPYLYEGVRLSTVNRQLETGTSSRGFKVALLHHTSDFGDYRWTVDTAEDLEFIRQVYGRFDGRDDFAWTDVLELVHNEPQLMEINAGVRHKTLDDLDPRASGH